MERVADTFCHRRISAGGEPGITGTHLGRFASVILQALASDIPRSLGARRFEELRAAECGDMS